MMNWLLAGVGGQGTVLASKVLAQAGMNRGLDVRTAETIGMAQRGGCVVSHVRMGEDIASPMIPKGGADVLIGFEPAEAVRCLPYLKPDGLVVVNTKAVQPVTATLTGAGYDGAAMLDALTRQVARLLLVDGEAVCRLCGSSKVLNVALLGAAVGSRQTDLTLEEVEAALRQRLPECFQKINGKALREGAAAGGKAR